MSPHLKQHLYRQSVVVFSLYQISYDHSLYCVIMIGAASACSFHALLPFFHRTLSEPILLSLSRHGEPPLVAVLVLAEPTDIALLVEVWPGGADASRSGPAGAARLPPVSLGLGRSRCLAPQYHPRALPFLQVCTRTYSASSLLRSSDERKHFGHFPKKERKVVFLPGSVAEVTIEWRTLEYKQFQ